MPDDGRLVLSPGTAEAPPTSTEAPQSRSDDTVERPSGPPSIAVRPSAVATASFVLLVPLAPIGGRYRAARVGISWHHT
jgi:hypothetical protein